MQEEVRAALDEMLDAQNAGDAGRLRCMVAERPDAVHVGSDAGEWRAGKEVVDAVAAAGNDDVQVVAGGVDVHLLGDLAWAEGRGRFTSPGGGERPMRMTAVLVREDGRWMVVQSHAFVGVPGADIFRWHPESPAPPSGLRPSSRGP